MFDVKPMFPLGRCQRCGADEVVYCGKYNLCSGCLKKYEEAKKGARTIREWKRRQMKNRFEIIGSIDKLTLSDFIRFVDASKSKKLEILIFSSGGSGEVALSICDYMKASGKEFTTIGIGQVESAASVIFFMGNKRFSYKNTYFMIHKGKLSNNSIMAGFEHKKRIKLYNEEAQNIIPLPIKKRIQYFSAEELLEMGLIDKII